MEHPWQRVEVCHIRDNHNVPMLYILTSEGLCVLGRQPSTPLQYQVVASVVISSSESQGYAAVSDCTLM